MNVKTNRKLLNEAINSGCKTAAELALFLKIRTNISVAYANR
jgi:hypothetical protein